MAAWRREGGIKAFGKRYAIIHLMLDADGRLTNAGSNWNVSAKCTCILSLDLCLMKLKVP
jgi:hypothetical protein